jgi:3-isopropylmalate dehydrogenase
MVTQPTPQDADQLAVAETPNSYRWTNCLSEAPSQRTATGAIVIGVLPGEGVGPEVIGCALQVLRAVGESTGLQFEIRQGGVIGRAAEQFCGATLSPEVIAFCQSTFAAGGAILNGPGGGRYVYDLRKRFDLFFKISPLQIVNGVPDASRLKPDALHGLDILVTRETTGGIYQGAWHDRGSSLAGRSAQHDFAYSEVQVRRFVEASARLARSRRGELTLVWKEAGLPSISTLWRRCAEEAAARLDVRLRLVDIDLMAYRLIQEAATFDVIAAPNLMGDVLGDLGAVLLGSRGLSYGGTYGPSGEAVYQTNHGAAHDLAGTDRANPAGQILALAMMLRESFGLGAVAQAIEEAVRWVWHSGWRTADVAATGTRIVGTREMGSLIAERVRQIALGASLAA